MTHETHNTEFKQSWRDEYLKWICGFANADGGTIFIGKDDGGRTVGVSNAKQLMEDIPNKIQMNLGIVCDVRSHVDGTDEFIEIAVDPSPYPVNYHGEFHYRSGATKQVLKGNALTRFIFDRTGLSWESVQVGDVDSDDLWRESFRYFAPKPWRAAA
ncbi:MAG: ATP-binding protein [Atopobiaceae bacterium]|nr:ATP-binding protein [Atopobiaceae bacterium]